eukprot:TRINITY_DN116_c0_g2_i1.p1 TRINITY_DN116_c0_g2~~TRINITY_DN116_c0_g2_i1.p1  ORF type:complete len:373 (-),score=141.58 TRINITY_DN116_c0_g2_i1:18-1136(-)
MALNGKTDLEKLQDLSTYTFKGQAIWWLNAYWDKHSDQAETLWSYVKKFSQLDLDKKEEGTGLDELNAHRFLESIGETKTVKELRDNLRGTGALGPNDRPKLVPLIHVLLFKYSGTTDWHYLVHAAQGDNTAEIDHAQSLLAQVVAAFEESAAKADAAAQALREAETRENESRKSEEEAKTREVEAGKREVEAQRAQEELKAALQELKAQEDAFNNKTNDLRTKSEDESSSVVSRNKAKNELAQHLGSDPLPLRKAKITQEAAVKKAEKTTAAAAEARKASEVAREAAIASRKAAEQAREAAVQAKAAADAAVEDAKKKVEEAENYLNEVKRKPGQAQGAIWWIQRGLEEAKNYVPERKGGIKRVDVTAASK